MVLTKIVFRNLLEHKVKTLIVGMLIALGTFVLVAGNSFLDSITAGLRKSYIENYTGDLILRTQGGASSLFSPGGSQTSALPGMGGSAPSVLPGYQELKTTLEADPQVAATLGLISGAATVSVGESTLGFSLLWGVDYEDYRTMFTGNLELVQGTWPQEAESTILLSETVHGDAEKELKAPLRIGDKILLSGFSDAGSKIREVTLAGVFRFRQGGAMLDRISLTDPGTLRGLKSLTLPVETSGEAPGAAPDLPGEELFSGDLFGEDLFSGDAGTPAPAGGVDYDSLLGDTSVREKYYTEDLQAWNFLLVRLKDPGAAGHFTEKLRSGLAGPESGLTVSDWRWGAGVAAEMAYSLQVIFNLLVAVIVFVAVIIIMNTLVISVTERIPEIGTMRAIGAQKGFVRKMIILETLMIAGVFGLAGSLVGAAAIATAGQVGIAAPNDFLRLLFGGEVFYPGVSWSSLGISVAVMGLVGILASLYPVSVALKISPVKAMSR